MGVLVNLIDFKSGKFLIPDAENNYAAAKVTSAIADFEKSYIYKLLGITEGNKFITWVNASMTPANAFYLKIKDAFSEDLPSLCGNQVHSLGMKQFLMGCIFYEYMRNGLTATPAGVVNVDVEKSKKVTPGNTMRYAESRFNEIVSTAEAIQWYCLDNMEQFPDFNGEQFKVKYSGIL